VGTAADSTIVCTAARHLPLPDRNSPPARIAGSTSPPPGRRPGALDFHVSDTYFVYFVVAHFHYVVFGTIVFATFSGIYFWFPKMTGRFLDEGMGKFHFWTTFIGFP